MARFENIQAGMQQSFAQERGVASEAIGIVPPDHDCDGYLDRREPRRQRSQVGRVRAWMIGSENPFVPKPVTHPLGMKCYRSARNRKQR